MQHSPAPPAPWLPPASPVASQDVHEGGFPSSRGAHDPNELPLAELPRQAFEESLVAWRGRAAGVWLPRAVLQGLQCHPVPCQGLCVPGGVSINIPRAMATGAVTSSTIPAPSPWLILLIPSAEEAPDLDHSKDQGNPWVRSQSC